MKIDEYISSLFADLTEWEYENLKEDIKKHGIKNPLVVSQDDILVCGHQRYKIAQELKLPDKKIPKIIVKFKDRQELIDYAINDNILRRNVNLYQKALLGLRILPIYKKEAKKRQLATLEQAKEGKIVNPQNFGGRGEALKLVADRIGVSHETLRKVKKISESELTTKLQKENLLKGEVSITSVFNEIKDQEKAFIKAKKKRHNLTINTAFDTPDEKFFILLAKRFWLRNDIGTKDVEKEKGIRIFDKDGIISMGSSKEYSKRALAPFVDINNPNYNKGSFNWNKIDGQLTQSKFRVMDLLYVLNLLDRLDEYIVDFRFKENSPIEIKCENFSFLIGNYKKKKEEK